MQDFDAFGWIDMLKTEGVIDVPFDEGHELVDRLLDMPQLPRVELRRSNCVWPRCRQSPSRT